MDALKSGAIFRVKDLSKLRSPPPGGREPSGPPVASSVSSASAGLQSNISSKFDDLYRATPLPAMLFGGAGGPPLVGGLSNSPPLTSAPSPLSSSMPPPSSAAAAAATAHGGGRVTPGQAYLYAATAVVASNVPTVTADRRAAERLRQRLARRALDSTLVGAAVDDMGSPVSRHVRRDGGGRQTKSKRSLSNGGARVGGNGAGAAATASRKGRGNRRKKYWHSDEEEEEEQEQDEEDKEEDDDEEEIQEQQQQQQQPQQQEEGGGAGGRKRYKRGTAEKEEVMNGHGDNTHVSYMDSSGGAFSLEDSAGINPTSHAGSGNGGSRSGSAAHTPLRTVGTPSPSSEGLKRGAIHSARRNSGSHNYGTLMDVVNDWARESGSGSGSGNRDAGRRTQSRLWSGVDGVNAKPPRSPSGVVPSKGKGKKDGGFGKVKGKSKASATTKASCNTEGEGDFEVHGDVPASLGGSGDDKQERTRPVLAKRVATKQRVASSSSGEGHSRGGCGRGRGGVSKTTTKVKDQYINKPRSEVATVTVADVPQETHTRRGSRRALASQPPAEWTAEQLESLRQAYGATSSKKANLWAIVANQVPGKDAEACERRWELDKGGAARRRKRGG